MSDYVKSDWKQIEPNSVNWENDLFCEDSLTDWYIYQISGYEPSLLVGNGFRPFNEVMNIMLDPSADEFDCSELMDGYLTALKIQGKIDHMLLINPTAYVAIIPGIWGNAENCYVFAFVPENRDLSIIHGTYYISNSPLIRVDEQLRRFAVVTVTTPPKKITPKA